MELKGENRSLEHIIQNSIGGKLKSYDLICRKCNSELGETVDTKFEKYYHFFMVKLNIEKERGKTRPFKIKADDGYEYFLYSDGNIELKSIIKRENGEIIPKHLSKTYLKKYESKDINYKLETKYSLPPPISLEIGNISQDLKIGILKIALNYAVLNKISLSKLEKCICELKIRKEESVIPYNYETSQLNGIFHRIKLQKIEDKLVCIITLFSVFNFIVILYDNYNEELDEIEHVENLKGDWIEKLEINSVIDYDYLWDLFYSTIEIYTDNLIKLMEITYDIEKENLCKKATEEILKKINLEKNFEEIIKDEAKLHKFLELPINKFVGSLLRNEELINKK